MNIHTIDFFLHNWLVWMYPKEFARPVKQKVLEQAKGYAYVCKQLILLGVCNAFLWRSFCLEAFASFYAYGPMSDGNSLDSTEVDGQL